MNRPETDRKERYRAPALDKGLDILEVLAGQAEPLTRAQIVAAMGRSASEIYRMLERLVARGYVARMAGGDRYILTMKLFELATRHPPLRRLVTRAQPLMDALADRVRQSCHLVVPERGGCMVIAQAGPVDNWEFRVRIGAILDPFATGSGQTLLAFQPPDGRIAMLDRMGAAGGAGELAALAPHLARIREAGYRQAPSGQVTGVIDLSAPVLGPDGDATAVLTCAYMEHPAEPDQAGPAETLAALRALAAELSVDAAALPGAAPGEQGA